jgi:ABC-2 type transport system permease protein
MTATNSPRGVAAARAGSHAGSRPGHGAGFRAALLFEWTKIRTVRSTYWTLLCGVAGSVGLSAALALSVVSAGRPPSAQDQARFDATAYGLVGLNAAMIAFAVLGATAITGEYAGGMIRLSLAANPCRAALLAAKAVVVAAVVLVVGELTALGTFLLGQAIYATKGLSVPLADPAALRAIAGGGLYVTLVALFALGVGTIMRRTGSALGAVLCALVILPVLATFLSERWATTIGALLPATAGGAILNTKASEASLPPWTGIALLALYTALTLGVAFVLFDRRDT